MPCIRRRFQLEEAISVHGERGRSGQIEWAAIVGFYEQLNRISPTLGRRTGYAAALAEANRAEQGLAVLDAIDKDAVQPAGRFALVSCSDLEKAPKPSTLTTERSDWLKIQL
jgi:predicted RNA polymerase sigma factor